MRDRLIELLDNIFHSDFNGDYENGIRDIADRLLANGVIVPPCKVGDMLNGEIVEDIEYGEHLPLYGTKYTSNKIYTRDPEEKSKVYCSHPMTWEEAEQALKEGKEK